MRTSVIIDTKVRDMLKHVGRKDQTYDELITELCQLKAAQTGPGTNSIQSETTHIPTSKEENLEHGKT